MAPISTKRVGGKNSFSRSLKMQGSNTHSVLIGYILWLFGFLGSHRFYFGKPISGIVWFLTFGLFGLGWIIDLVLIPDLDDEADKTFKSGDIDYTVSWLLLTFGGFLGLHRFYMKDYLIGILFLCTAGFLGIGWVYDFCTLNHQISLKNGGNGN